MEFLVKKASSTFGEVNDFYQNSAVTLKLDNISYSARNQRIPVFFDYDVEEKKEEEEVFICPVVQFEMHKSEGGDKFLGLPVGTKFRCSRYHKIEEHFELLSTPVELEHVVIFMGKMTDTEQDFRP